MADSKGKAKKMTKNKELQLFRQHAAKTGELPHEFLLRVARGEPIDHYQIDPKTKTIVQTVVVPSLEQRIKCAEKCANYFVPKLAAHVIKDDRESEVDALAKVLMEGIAKLPD